MGAPLLHFGAIVMCPHGGNTTFIPTQTRVLLSGQPAIVASDMGVVAGCALSPTATGPCTTVQYLVPATRVRIQGQPAVLSTSTGLCKLASQAPTGSPITASSQVRVSGQ